MTRLPLDNSIFSAIWWGKKVLLIQADRPNKENCQQSFSGIFIMLKAEKHDAQSRQVNGYQAGLNFRDPNSRVVKQRGVGQN